MSFLHDVMNVIHNSCQYGELIYLMGFNVTQRSWHFRKQQLIETVEKA